MHRVLEAGEVEVALEGVDLATEGVAAHGDVQATEGLLPASTVLDPIGEQDHAGAGAQGRHPGGDPLPEWLEEVEGAGQLGDRGGLPARNHECVSGVELGRSAYGLGGEAEAVQRPEVLAYVALERQDADAQR